MISGLVTLIVASVAYADTVRPVGLDPAVAAVPGQALSVPITLSDSTPTNVTVSSSPAGVSWSGTISGGSTVVNASTSSTLSGPVLVQVSANGVTVSKYTTFYPAQ